MRSNALTECCYFEFRSECPFIAHCLLNEHRKTDVLSLVLWAKTHMNWMKHMNLPLAKRQSTWCSLFLLVMGNVDWLGATFIENLRVCGPSAEVLHSTLDSPIWHDVGEGGGRVWGWVPHRTCNLTTYTYPFSHSIREHHKTNPLDFSFAWILKLPQNIMFKYV